ncbi:hypothetical protein C8N47_13713 [Mangrovibacterium marinum]|uniref:Glycosyltransferase 2-like domain-containing protein n=1 Tax=Mangrovibacterium marinum TaxID=1639118 RepID=A0A2T5BTT4_9BACT|nr:glycosyltransferase family 2 protein [Mangrovibacterium marinum]PTN02883.1 hypothetical protein C8N47_13713 [Mangrovibacterium marinum]
MRIDASIIIVNYNTKELTLQCLKSIYKQTKGGVSFEVIVVDNGSKDNSVVSIREQYPQIVLIESNKNLGFGKANNLGAKQAKGKYLFLLNSDTILLNNAVKIFFDYCEQEHNPDISLAGSILLDIDKKPIHSSGNFPSKRKILRLVLGGYLDRNYFENNNNIERLNFTNKNHFIVDYITGADLFIRKDLFNRINGFDRDYFMYYEDSDLQKRTNDLGYKSYIINGPQIIHLEGKSNKKPSFNLQKRKMVTKSMFTYFRKHSNIATYIFFRVLYLLARTPILFDNRIKIKERLSYLTFLTFN